MINEAKIGANVNMKEWPPVRVEIPDTVNPFKLELYFAHIGADAPFLGFQVTDRDALDPKAFAHLARNLPKYVAYARAFVEWRDDWPELVSALREAGKTRRGLPDTFYRGIAVEYEALVVANDPHPIKTIAEKRPVDKSRASRWVTEARRRGYIEAADD